MSGNKRRRISFLFSSWCWEGGGRVSSGVNKHEGAEWIPPPVPPVPPVPLVPPPPVPRLVFFYLLCLLLQTSFEFSVFCNLRASEADVKLRLPLTCDTGQAGTSTESPN